jgi:serine/threonine protein kinase
LTRDGVAKLADFGLARKYNARDGRYTNNVVTPWYRAPELILGAENYSSAVDIWSVGCVLGEFMLKKPLFPYANPMELLDNIFKLCGTPNPNTCPNLCNLKKWCQPKTMYKNRIREEFREFDNYSSIVKLLQSMLELDPAKRITAKEALKHPWFSEYPPPQPRCMKSLLDFTTPLNEHWILKERKKSRHEQSYRHPHSPRQSNRHRYLPIQKQHKMSLYSGRPHERKSIRPHERRYNVR